MHDAGVVFAGKDIPGTAHIRRQLVDFIDPRNGGFHQIGVAKIAHDKLVRRRFGVLVAFDVYRPDPISFGLQPSYEMASDEAAGAIHQDSFQVFYLQLGKLREPPEDP
jgi:hypothetical protein